MKKFLINILVFIIPLLFGMYVADALISEKLRYSHQPPGEFEVWSDIYNGNLKSDLAVYGSSRAWVHIDPKVLEDSLGLKTYNFGIDGHNFWLQYLRHLEYIEYNKKPKAIIVAVDIYSLQKRNDLFEYDQFLPYMLWNENIKLYTDSYNGFEFGDYYLPLVRYFGELRGPKAVLKFGYNENFQTPYRDKGFRGIDKKWNKDLEKAKIRMKKYVVKLHRPSIDLFNKFLEECQISDIEVILVYAPEYIEGQNFIANKSEVIKVFQDFRAKYNLIFLDYSDDAICNQRDLFYNASHLNKGGAELFSRKLAADLKRSGLVIK